MKIDIKKYIDPKHLLSILPSTVLAAISALTAVSMIYFESDDPTTYMAVIMFTILLSVGLYTSEVLKAISKNQSYYLVSIAISVAIAIYVSYFGIIGHSSTDISYGSAEAIPYDLAGIIAITSPIVAPLLLSENNKSSWNHMYSALSSILFAALVAGLMQVTLLILSWGVFTVFEGLFFSDSTIYKLSGYITAINVLFSFPLLSYLHNISASSMSVKKIEYPEILQKVARFVLTPIFVLYSFVLLSFLVKYTVTGNIQPVDESSVYIFIFGVITLGIYLMLFPVTDKFQIWEKIIRYGVGLLALTVGLYTALFVKYYFLSGVDYGVTVNRGYAVLVLTYSFILAAYIFYKGRSMDIRYIPLSLVALFVLITYIPYLNVTEVALRSQTRRFKENLELYKVYPSGSIDLKASDLLKSEKEELGHSARYLFDFHGEESLESIDEDFFDDVYSGWSAQEKFSLYYYGHGGPVNFDDSGSVEYINVSQRDIVGYNKLLLNQSSSGDSFIYIDYMYAPERKAIVDGGLKEVGEVNIEDNLLLLTLYGSDDSENDLFRLEVEDLPGSKYGSPPGYFEFESVEGNANSSTGVYLVPTGSLGYSKFEEDDPGVEGLNVNNIIIVIER